MPFCRAGIMADPSGFGKKGGEAAKEKGELPVSPSVETEHATA